MVVLPLAPLLNCEFSKIAATAVALSVMSRLCNNEALHRVVVHISDNIEVCVCTLNRANSLKRPFSGT